MEDYNKVNIKDEHLGYDLDVESTSERFQINEHPLHFVKVEKPDESEEAGVVTAIHDSKIIKAEVEVKDEYELPKHNFDDIIKREVEEVKDEPDIIDIKFESVDSGSKRPTIENTGKLFECHNCSYKSKYKQNLKQHIMFIHEKERAPRYACEICSYQTIQKSSLKTHMKIHSGFCLECTLCQKSFKRKLHLDAHYVTAHWDQSDSIKHLLTNKVNECSKCSYKTLNITYFKRHLSTHEENRIQFTFECNFCGYKSTQEGRLKLHMRLHADQLEEDKEGGANIKEKTLDQELKRPAIENGENQFSCHKCNYKTKHRSTLKQHIMNIHERENSPRYSCDLCSYGTIQKSALKTHMRIHSGFSMGCTLCQKSFKHKQQLDAHYVSTHSDQSESFKHLLTYKVWQCSKCSYAAVHRANFKKHLLTHDEKRSKFKPRHQNK